MGMGIADGYLVSSSQYDNLLYCIGKGPSATTVSVPQSGVSMGSSFTVTGAVTDQSPGATALAQEMGYLNGVPCVPDESQEAWMEYLYQQQSKPSTTSGVPVTIDVIDPNGNYVNLGTTHSDSSGTYIFSVTPEMLSAGPGTYTVISSFAGSESYGPSYSESGFTVNSEPAATAAPTPTPLSMAETYFVPAIAAVFTLLVIIIVIQAVQMLRKRP